MKILIIEDSTSQIRLLNKIVLQIDGIEPILAEDALEGFAILRAIPSIGLIILDNDMPYINGFDFLKKIKNDPLLKKIPIAFSTANANTEPFINAGAAECFIKPYNIEDFKRFIDEVKEGKK